MAFSSTTSHALSPQHGAAAGQLPCNDLPADWAASIEEPGTLEAGIRQVVDIAAALLILLLALPLCLLVAAAIKCDSSGPVFYRQIRVGLNGRAFGIWKFRSMRTDAEQNGAAWAAQGDSRVTRVGRILRFTRLDEVPQVLNVLSGAMSLVGPRPERPVFVEQLEHAIPRFADRLLVKPGITGWAQVNYPYGASVEDARQKLSYDLYYIQNRSLLLDMHILLKTVGVVLFGSGAR